MIMMEVADFMQRPEFNIGLVVAGHYKKGHIEEVGGLGFMRFGF